MDINHHTQPKQLERYSFLWSEARLVIAAVALFLGGIPPAYYIIIRTAPGLFFLTRQLLVLAWVISGIASVYMVYRWNKGGQLLFGKKEQKDTYAFWVSVVSGFNLGLAGLLGSNIGMSIASGRLIFLVVGVIYLASAWHLWQRSTSHGGHIF